MSIDQNTTLKDTGLGKMPQLDVTKGLLALRGVAKRCLTLSALMFGLGLSSMVFSSELDIPNSFSAGSAAVAADVNANFTSAETAVNDNNTRIGSLETTAATLETDLSSLETDVGGNDTDIAALLASITALQASVASLETTVGDLEGDNTSLQNFISTVIPYLTGGMDAQGEPTVFFSGANLHVNNGDVSGDTATNSGTGNLIIGFDENTSSGREFCSGAEDSFGNHLFIDNEIDCTSNGGNWNDGTTSNKSGSHNLVLGSSHSYTSYGGLVTGEQNIISAPSAAVMGIRNLAGGVNSVVSGGERNTASGFSSSVSGGSTNIASRVSSSVSGGIGNTSSGSFGSVSVGLGNIASGGGSVSGGFDNEASDAQSSVSGGFSNIASGAISSVSGGSNNEASGALSTVSGGELREATGRTDWVAGSLLEDD